MKALTLTQPWATLVAIGAKKIETRSWRTKYTGPLAIHAAKGFPRVARDFTLDPIVYESYRNIWPDWPAYPQGCILATCYLTGSIPVDVFGVSVEPLSDREKAFGDYSAGRYAWLLGDVRPLATPIPVKGALGLWEWNQ